MQRIQEGIIPDIKLIDSVFQALDIQNMIVTGTRVQPVSLATAYAS